MEFLARQHGGNSFGEGERSVVDVRLGSHVLMVQQDSLCILPQIASTVSPSNEDTWLASL